VFTSIYRFPHISFSHSLVSQLKEKEKEKEKENK